MGGMNSPAASRSPAPLTAAQRQARYRSRLRERGSRRLAVVVPGGTFDLVHRLAQEQGVSPGRILELGALLARRELAKRTGD